MLYVLIYLPSKRLRKITLNTFNILIMKIFKLLLYPVASALILAGCTENEENFGDPSINVDPAELSFGTEAASNTVTLVATRDWTAAVEPSDADWITVEPAFGDASTDAQTVTVTVLENAGANRSATVTFAANNGMVSTPLEVTQTGPGGTVEDTYVFANDFDKTEATKTYGNEGTSWPYLDQFDGWQNQTGTGAGPVTYSYDGTSVRNNSNSNSNYSDYADQASGLNNIFFGTNAFLQINDIALDASVVNYTLSFGTEKYVFDATDNTFDPEEFHVYISNDGQKWVELEYTFPDGFKNGRWDLASSTFTLPSGTETLSIYISSDIASAHRLDDLVLAISSESGTNIDFSQGVEIGGDDTPEPDDIKDVTVAEFLAAPVSSDTWYRLSGTVGGPINTQYGNFDITDETGTVYVYGTSNFSDFTVNEGDNITIVGQRYEYNGKDEVIEAYIEEVIPGEAPEPTEPIEATIAEFLDAPVSSSQYYILTGEITELANTTYGNFTLVDATGEVYVYGLTATQVTSNDKSFSSLGLKEGDTVTLCGTRDEYGGESQVGGPAYYISHEPGEEEPEEPVDPDSPYVSNVTWSLGPNSYNEEATVNGEGPVDVVKIGKSKTKGSIDITIPSGTTQVNFYAVSWNSETATLSFVMNGKEVASQSIAKNAGAANSQPYTFTVTESDYYTFKTPMPLPTDMTITVTTQENARAILWGIKAVSE